MSRYLGRVLARSTGRPLGQIQAAPALRWPGAGGDLEGTMDRGADAAPESSGPGRAASGLENSEPSPPGHGDPGRGPEWVESSKRRPSDPGLDETRPGSRGGDEPRPTGERVRIVRVGGDTARPTHAEEPRRPDPPTPAGPSVEPPARARRTESDKGETRPSGAAGVRGSPAVAVPSDTRSASGRTSQTPVQTTALVTPSPSHPAPREPSRTNVVIGRVSVIVEAPPQTAPTAPTIVRVSAPAARPTEDGPGLANRFGLGQL